MAEVKLQHDLDKVMKDVKAFHDGFMKYVDDVRASSRLPFENRMSIADSVADNMGIMYYEGYFVDPERVIPQRVKDAIDESKNEKSK